MGGKLPRAEKAVVAFGFSSSELSICRKVSFLLNETEFEDNVV
jgi:hypothetical protein